MHCSVQLPTALALPRCTCSTTRKTNLRSRPAKCTPACNPLTLKPYLRQSQTAFAPFTGSNASRKYSACKRTTRCSATSTAVGLGIFFTPSVVAVIYAYFKGKGNVKDGLSRLLTEVTQGYFQPNVGGESIPVAQGELSDLAGDEPLFKALYQW